VFDGHYPILIGKVSIWEEGIIISGIVKNTFIWTCV